jgi:hypothetical protein
MYGVERRNYKKAYPVLSKWEPGETLIRPRPVRRDMEITPRTAGTLGVLALVPALAYGLFRSNAFAAAVTATNVLIIAYSLRQLTGPAEGDGARHHPGERAH